MLFDGTSRLATLIVSTGRNIQTNISGPVGGAYPADRTGSGNVLLSTSITRFDQAGRVYEQQQNVSAGSITLPSGRSVTHTSGGLTANSASNTNTGVVTTLTSGGITYVLTRIFYDGSDRVIKTAADNLGLTTTAYDGANRAILVTDPLGNTMSYAYDGNGNVVQTLSTETYVYDEDDDTTVETFTSVAFYDCLNRTVATATQGADGNFAPILSAASNYSGGSTGSPTTMFSLMAYDSRGNATLSVDPNGNSVITEYDGASRRIETDQLLRINGQGSNSPAGNQSFLSAGRGLVRTQMVYDGNSRLVTLIDDKGNQTGYAYDLLDRQVTMTFQDGSVRTNVFDLAGDVVTYTDENGSAFASSFDPLGRRYAVGITRATGINGTTSQSFQYDGLSRMTQAVDFLVHLRGNASCRTSNNTVEGDCGSHQLIDKRVLETQSNPGGWLLETWSGSMRRVCICRHGQQLDVCSTPHIWRLPQHVPTPLPSGAPPACVHSWEEGVRRLMYQDEDSILDAIAEFLWNNRPNSRVNKSKEVEK